MNITDGHDTHAAHAAPPAAPRPPLLLATLVVALLTALYGVIRLYVFRDTVLPLTFVLPLLVCLWTRRAWHLWAMVAAFVAMTVVKYVWQMPDSGIPAWDWWSSFAAIMTNVAVGGAVVQFVMRQRDRLEAHNARIAAQNAELEAQAEELSQQAEELSQQNEEIKAQAEELAQQNEEIESQAEELERQNQELQVTTERLGSREGMLQAVLQTSRTAGGGGQVLDEVCRRALEILGEPAEALAVLEFEPGGASGDRDGDGEPRTLRLRASARAETQPPLREAWPLDASLARVVLREDRTAYVDDLRERRDLAAPFAAEGTVQSLLVTPLRVGGKQAGVLAVCGRGASHWTRDQFRLVEWVAAQCGLIVEGLRWQSAIKQHAADVEAANRAKDQFLATLSHELRTPLTPVLAAAGTLEADARLPEDVREDLGVIRRNVAIQSRLIDDLLDLTRVGRGKLELHRQVVGVAALLRDAAAIVAGDLDAKEQTLTVESEPAQQAAVYGDGARLQQVFWNLLKNAIKFSPAKSRIAVTARVAPASDPGHPPRVVVQVIDHGMGIDPADAEKIFQPFEQAAGARHRDNVQGLGLGLCIAKAVVELHGGTIRAASPGRGKGSTFTVELPLSDKPLPTAQPAEDDRTPTAAAGPAPLRILLVEDHFDTGRLLARLLRTHGHAVEHARDMAGALRLVRDGAFDLLVSDLGLPDGSGLDLMREVRAIRPRLAGICLSGYGTEGDKRSSQAAGFAEHLIKPVDVQLLRDAIGRIARDRLAGGGGGGGEVGAATDADTAPASAAE